MSRNYANNSKRPYYNKNRSTSNRFTYAPKQEEADKAPILLSPSSVCKVFYNLFIKNINAKTYDETFFKLQAIMKSTFKTGKPVNIKDLQMFNAYGLTTSDAPITIKRDNFEAERWSNLYVRSIPDIKLPAYDQSWSVPFLWVFDNIQTSIDGIDRSKWIEQTRTFDKESGEMEKSHDEYEKSVNARKDRRVKIIQLLTDIIKLNHEQICPSMEDKLVIPSFMSEESIHKFYALRLVWTLITMHANHINYGDELNRLTVLINPDKTYSIDEYIAAMKELRSDSTLKNVYGDKLCELLAKLIEAAFMLHHSNGPYKDNPSAYASTMIEEIIGFLDTQGAIIPKKRLFGDPMRRTLKLIKNRYSPTTKVEITALLQTYPVDVLKKYLLDDFVSDNALTDTMFDSFLLMHKLYDLPTIKQAIIGGFCARSNNIKIHQLACAMVFGIIKPEECMIDDTFLKAPQRIDSLIIALESSPVAIGRAIISSITTALQEMESTITIAQATKLYDCFEKINIECPRYIVSKMASH